MFRHSADCFDHPPGHAILQLGILVAARLPVESLLIHAS